MEIQDSSSVYYSMPDARKQVFKVGRVTRCTKKVWVQDKRDQVFNGVCRVIQQGERAQMQRDTRRAKR
jgi:hypothetical protein